MGGVNDLFSLEEIEPTDEQVSDVLGKLDDLDKVQNDLKKVESTKPKAEKIVKEVKEASKPKSTSKMAKEVVKKVAEKSPVKPKPKPKTEVVKIQEINQVTPDMAKAMGLDKDFVDKYQAVPKKAKSKFINLINWFLYEEKLSVYTELCFMCLLEKNTTKSADFRICMMSNTERPYPPGTAGSQAGQLMAVFPAMNIGELNDKSIVLKSSSPLVVKFKKQISK